MAQIEETTALRRVPPATAIVLCYRLILRQLLTPGRIVVLTLLALVATVSASALGVADASLDDGVGLLAGLGFGVVVPVVCLVFGGAAIGDLRDDKTLVYVWLRPIDRWPVVAYDGCDNTLPGWIFPKLY